MAFSPCAMLRGIAAGCFSSFIGSLQHAPVLVAWVSISSAFLNSYSYSLPSPAAVNIRWFFIAFFPTRQCLLRLWTKGSAETHWFWLLMISCWGRTTQCVGKNILLPFCFGWFLSLQCTCHSPASSLCVAFVLLTQQPQPLGDPLKCNLFCWQSPAFPFTLPPSCCDSLAAIRLYTEAGTQSDLFNVTLWNCFRGKPVFVRLQSLTCGDTF